MLQQLEREVGNDPGLFDNISGDIPEQIDEDISADDYLDLFHQGVQRLAGSLAETESNDLSSLSAMNKGRLCFHISICHLLHIGTKFSLSKGLSWFWAAALGCHKPAMPIAPLLHHHYAPQSSPLRQQRLLLSLGGLSRNLQCMDILALRWPGHYQALLRVIREKWHTCLSTDQNFNMMHPLDTVNFYRQFFPAPDAGLIDKILSYDLDCVQRLLDAGGDAGMVSNEGISALHALTYLRDADAVDLATILVDRGASLSASWPDSPDIFTCFGRKISGSPLFCAISCNQIGLAKTLITLHGKRKVKVKDYARILIFTVFYWCHELVEALLDLIQTHPSLCDAILTLNESEELEGVSEFQIHPRHLLLLAMDRPDLLSLERRVRHGPLYDEAYAKTLELLIARGADPTKGIFESCPLYECLENDDTVALRCFILYLYENCDGDPLTPMIDPGHIRKLSSGSSEHTGLQFCIYSKSVGCFHILLDEFPLLMEEKNARGLTALHSASEHPDNIPLLRALLERGANVLAAAQDDTTPLYRALANCNTEGADLIMQYCSSEQIGILLSRQPDTGHSLFSILTHAWFQNRDIKLLDSFKWIIDHGGAHFYGEIRTVRGNTIQIPSWNDLLAKVRPSRRSSQLQDLALATLLLDTFPEQINVIQEDGRSLLHVAAWYGHVEIVRLLLKRGADVNLEYSSTGVWGKTALNMSIRRRKSSQLPESVHRGGFEEVSCWRADCEAIIQLLRKAGGRSGSGADAAEDLEVLALGEDSYFVLNYMYEPGPFEQDKVWRGAWPHALPRDISSMPEPDLAEMNKEMKGAWMLLLAMHDVVDASHREAVEESLGDDYRSSLRSRADEARQSWRLPMGWKVRRVEGSDRFYFENDNTKSKTWVKPPLAGRWRYCGTE